MRVPPLRWLSTLDSTPTLIIFSYYYLYLYHCWYDPVVITAFDATEDWSLDRMSCAADTAATRVVCLHVACSAKAGLTFDAMQDFDMFPMALYCSILAMSTYVEH